MKTTVLFGAGQFGAMIARLMGTDYAVSCFADNYEGKWGTRLAGIPVLSPEESLKPAPDCVCLCVMDEERAGQMEAQIRKLGFEGPILRPNALKTFDARAAVMRLLAEQIHEENIPGAAAEFGVFRGDFAACINAAFPDRTIHLFDTFAGFPEEDVKIEREQGFPGPESGTSAKPRRRSSKNACCIRKRRFFTRGFSPGPSQTAGKRPLPSSRSMRICMPPRLRRCRFSGTASLRAAYCWSTT